jgi:arsenate reductase
MENKPAILFLCTGNSARSQMADGYLRHVVGDRYDVYSAGTEPRPVHPMAVKVMKEIGIDISSQRSKGFEPFLGKQNIQVAIFVCDKAQRNCPFIYPFAWKVYSWPFEDPAEPQVNEEIAYEKFRHVRDQIIIKIDSWLGGK